MRYSRILIVVALGLLGASFLEAQTKVPPSADDSDARAQEQKRLLQQANSLINEAIGELDQIKTPENRVRLLALTASLLWESDESRARSFLTQARAGFGQMIQSLDPDDPQSQNRLNRLLQGRREILWGIASHDPELALEFLRATQTPPLFQLGPYNSYDTQEQELEMNLATRLAAKDPQRSLSIALSSLQKGVHYSALNLLTQIQNTNPSAAATLLNAIVTKLGSVDFSRDQNALYVPMNLLQTALNFRQTVSTTTPAKPLPPLWDDAILQRLADLLVAGWNNITGSPFLDQRGARGSMLQGIRSMMPLMEKISPPSAAKLRTLLENNAQDPQLAQADQFEQMNSVIAKGNIDEILQSASKFPVEMRDNFYQQAAWKAIQQGDFGRAESIARNNLTNPFQRDNLLKNIQSGLTNRLIREGKIQEARQKINEIRSDVERVRALIQLAMELRTKDKPTALQLLVEAQGFLGGRLETQSQISAQMELANGYASLDSPKSFDLLEAIPDRLNNGVNASEVLDGIEREYSPSFRDGELLFFAGNPVLGLLDSFGNQLASAARLDPERARSLANRINHVEVRLKVKLDVARSLYIRTKSNTLPQSGVAGGVSGVN